MLGQGFCAALLPSCPCRPRKEWTPLSEETSSCPLRNRVAAFRVRFLPSSGSNVWYWQQPCPVCLWQSHFLGVVQNCLCCRAPASSSKVQLSIHATDCTAVRKGQETSFSWNGQTGGSIHCQVKLQECSKLVLFWSLMEFGVIEAKTVLKQILIHMWSCGCLVADLGMYPERQHCGASQMKSRILMGTLVLSVTPSTIRYAVSLKCSSCAGDAGS